MRRINWWSVGSWIFKLKSFCLPKDDNKATVCSVKSGVKWSMKHCSSFVMQILIRSSSLDIYILSCSRAKILYLITNYSTTSWFLIKTPSSINIGCIIRLHHVDFIVRKYWSYWLITYMHVFYFVMNDIF
jgi:hypothetical protein